MGHWKGLDAGGTEQLWESDLLKDVLAIFKDNEPFSRGERESPIYNELEATYPDITWRNADSTSFRPIFRKTNPWVKLGLTTHETQDAHVTPNGDELLSGEKTIQDIYIEATKNHQEQDGTFSFAIMCRAALEAPNEAFTLEDIQFGVSEGYANGKQTLSVALDNVRRRKLTFPDNSRGARTLRAFMNVLVNSGAFVNTNQAWTLLDKAIASEIAQIQYSPTTQNISPNPLPKVARVSTANIRGIASGKRLVSPYSSSSSEVYDPIKRALLLEKANSVHEMLVEKCANDIREIGGHPVEDQNSFDVAEKQMSVIFEIKSINFINSISQIRKAVAQLLEYRYRHRDFFPKIPAIFLITNENLSKFVDAETINFLKLDQSINLFWLEDDALINHQGTALSEFLIQLL
jgi:hypothetical protein